MHYIATALFVVILVLNHKLGLALTPLDLCLLATVLGIHHVTTLVKLLRGKDST